jgi:hypothetical protein
MNIMNMKRSDPHEKIWKGEPWDEDAAAYMPRPSEPTRTAIFEAARLQAAAVTPKTFISRMIRWRLVPALGTVCILLLAAISIWYYREYRHTPVIAVADEPALEEMVEYVTSTYEPDEILAETTDSESGSIQDQFLAELAVAHETLASLEIDIEYDYFSL